MSTVRDFIADNLQKYRDHAHFFQQTFGVRLKPYFNNLTGFDVIKFDDYIQPKDDQSTREAVAEKYGQEAVELILKLIGGDS